MKYNVIVISLSFYIDSVPIRVRRRSYNICSIKIFVLNQMNKAGVFDSILVSHSNKKCFGCKNENFHWTNFDIFLIFALKHS